MELNNYISYDEICRHIENENNILEVKWNNINIAIRKIINVSEMIETVDTVISACLSPSGDFVPEVLPVIFMSNIIMRYSNIQMPDDIDKQSKLVYGSDLYEFICAHVCINQVNDIKNSIRMIIKTK